MKNMFKKLFFFSAVLLCSFSLANTSFAASTPTLTLTNNASTVSILVTGADPNATVNFYFPNYTDASTNNTSYVSIGLGQTNANGVYSVSVAPNSYGLNGGVDVYVSVDGVQSQEVAWPATVTSSNGSSGNLSLSQTNITLTSGLDTTIIPLNTSNTLTVQSNSNPSVALADIQSNNNSLLITGMNAGTTNISVCAATNGCASVAVSVTAPTQTITFSVPQAYVVMGQSPQSVNIYGPGGTYSISNTNTSALSAVVNGNTLELQGISGETGQVSVLVCAPGWNCGTLPVTILAAGSSVPYQVSTPAPASSDLSQTPQITSFSVSSNNVYNSFFGQSSTLNISFGINQTVKNLQVKVAGTIVPATQSTDGKYYAQYQLTGNESLPIPVAISFTNLGNISNQFYFSMGGSAPAQSSSQSSAGASSAAVVFSKYLYEGVTPMSVSNPQIVALQQRLTADGVYSGPITGYFGPLTKAGVEAYQKKHGLSPVGVVGPQTRALLNRGI